ncbi:Nuclease-related domain-containing protein [Desulfomicrobium norvegicum]|uniref:Nuclease-related domain-containing protein n=1 Tax=Desulfomicrobium norvegicum (strain DSM 1741 / NCIMB 8310) TaxID=52561 RepID=A0A8G2F6Y4_DESNO|nr:nuclease-related domain-containing protein [Desulfomicrobium norvegicum]SFM04667.1 Nuclease-related domain-containing protein [Desulfomicrobium norvegicum]
MAHIHGKAVQSGNTRASARHKDILLRLILPLLLVLMPAGAGLYAFGQNQPWITAIFAVFFIAATLRFEELGLAFSHHFSHSQTNSQASRIVSKALRQLPSEYHVFHDLHFEGNQLDHAVIGPNGLFLIRTRSHLGNVTASGESLRLNGWPFMLDMLTQCWNLTQKLTRHMDLQYAGGVHPCPVLCFSRASVGIAGPVRGALVVEAGNLVQAILAHDDALPADRMYVLIDKFTGLVNADTGSEPGDEDEPQADQAPLASLKSNRPVCAACRHQPSPEEFGLFPAECPKCGRLYAVTPEESETPSPAKPLKVLWKPSLLQLGMTFLLFAGCTGYVAHRQGLFGLEQLFIQSRQTATAEPEASEALLPAVENGSSPAVVAEQTAGADNETSTPPQADIMTPDPRPGTGMTQNEPASPVYSQSGDNIAPSLPEQALGVNASCATVAQALPNATSEDAQALPSAASAEAQALPKATSKNTDAPSIDTVQGSPAPAATLPKPKAETAQAPPRNPDESFDKGRLVVTSSRPLVLWFKNQQTCKDFGPFEIKAKSVKDIVLPKGFYSVVYLENGKRRHTTMSFLSDQGQLDF